MKSQEFLETTTKGPVKALHCGTLIDGRGGKPVKDAVVLIQGNRITKVGEKGKLKAPPGAESIDCSRYTVMPGMMDLHIHTAMHNCMTFHNHRVAQFETMPHLQQMYALFHAQNCFDMGFTTLRDLGMNGPYGLLVNEMCAVRDAINAGIVEGPRMLIAGFTTMTGSHLELIQPRAMYALGLQHRRRPLGAAQACAKELLRGCDVIKTCASGGGGTDKEEPDIRNMTQEELDAVVDEAHALHKLAAVHCFTTNAQRMAIKAGADTIEHMVFHDDETIEHDPQSRHAGDADAVAPHRSRDPVAARARHGRIRAEQDENLQPHCFKTFQKMYKAGIKIAMGTDMGFEPDMGTNAAGTRDLRRARHDADGRDPDRDQERRRGH